MISVPFKKSEAVSSFTTALFVIADFVSSVSVGLDSSIVPGDSSLIFPIGIAGCLVFGAGGGGLAVPIGAENLAFGAGGGGLAVPIRADNLAVGVGGGGLAVPIGADNSAFGAGGGGLAVPIGADNSAFGAGGGGLAVPV